MFGTDSNPTATLPGQSRKESREQRFLRIKQDVHRHLISAMDTSSATALQDHELRRELRRGIEDLCRYRADLLNETERERLINEVIDETLGAPVVVACLPATKPERGGATEPAHSEK